MKKYRVVIYSRKKEIFESVQAGSEEDAFNKAMDELEPDDVEDDLAEHYDVDEVE